MARRGLQESRDNGGPSGVGTWEQLAGVSQLASVLVLCGLGSPNSLLWASFPSSGRLRGGSLRSQSRNVNVTGKFPSPRTKQLLHPPSSQASCLTWFTYMLRAESCLSHWGQAPFMVCHIIQAGELRGGREQEDFMVSGHLSPVWPCGVVALGRSLRAQDTPTAAGSRQGCSLGMKPAPGRSSSSLSGCPSGNNDPFTSRLLQSQQLWRRRTKGPFHHCWAGSTARQPEPYCPHPAQAPAGRPTTQPGQSPTPLRHLAQSHLSQRTSLPSLPFPSSSVTAGAEPATVRAPDSVPGSFPH